MAKAQPKKQEQSPEKKVSSSELKVLYGAVICKGKEYFAGEILPKDGKFDHLIEMGIVGSVSEPVKVAPEPEVIERPSTVKEVDFVEGDVEPVSEDVIETPEA